MHNICSVVVLYNPTSTNVGNINKICEISHKLIIVDNSENDFSLEGFDSNKIEYIRNIKNIGLAKALNIGINRCIGIDDCTHIALFDQDSVPDKEMFVNLLKELDMNDDTVVAVSPQIVDIKNKKKQETNNSKFVEVVITSGSLYPKIAFEKVGLMDETFFIDYIDYEWCLRAKSKKFKILRVKNAYLYHNMGDSFVNFFGIPKPVHTNKLRHYYIIRNQIIMLNRDYVNVKWKCIHTFKLFYRIPSYIILSNEKHTTFKFIIRAIKDAFVNMNEYKKIKF